jgi:hypothetical protein
MEAAPSNSIEQPAVERPWLGLAALVLLLAWQGWLTLGLFGPTEPWRRLLDDEPILSGAHPQHQYLGAIGAEALQVTGRPCAYVPDFQAGFPKTPIFNGSRFGELFQFLGGGTYRPQAYKLGVFALCMLVPVLIVVAARGAGFNRGAALQAAAFGIFIWWGPHSRGALEAGESDLFLASLAVLAHLGMLLRFDRQPGILVWLGMLLTAALGWFAQPLLLPIALPLALLYYLCIGVRHANLGWHAALATAQLGALALQSPWLFDWVAYWWLRLPLPSANDLLPHRTLYTLWNAPLWGGPAERALALFLLGSAAAGVVMLYRTRERPTARLLGLGAGGLLTLAFLGISWEPLGQLGTTALLAPALWFAALPAALAWTRLAGILSTSLPRRMLLASLCLGMATAVWIARDFLAPIFTRSVASEPLQIGLGPERAAVVAALVDATTPEARILWEDRALPRHVPRWSALLPLLTQRSYLGGLDPDGFIEHSAISFLDQRLDGRHISTWTDEQLDEYCERYNIGWIVGWSAATIKRFNEWQGVQAATPLVVDVGGYLFTLKRNDRTFALKGQATLIQADTRHITLGDLVPDDDGVIVLSLHWQEGLRAAPGRVQVEREACGRDPIGFIRLRTASPVARLTLTWERP